MASNRTRRPSVDRAALEEEYRLLRPADRTKLQVKRPNSKFINTRAPYFAANLKNVCRVKKVGPSCWDGEDKLTKVWKGGASLEEKRQACKTRGGEFDPGYEEGLRSGKVELDFLSPVQARNRGTRPGPNLRVCFAGKAAGYLVPVDTPDDAVAIRDDLTRCLRGSTNDAGYKQCALKAAGGGDALVPFGPGRGLGGVRRKPRKKHKGTWR